MFEFIILLIVLFVIKKVYSHFRTKFTNITFEGQTVWITGASSGIGEQLAKDFCSLGASVIISSNQPKDLERVKSECKDPSKVTILALDLSKTKEVIELTSNFLKEFEKQGKKLDIVIENAGVSMRALFKDVAFENHEYVTNVNYNSPVAHVKVLLNHFINNKSGQIVLVNSISGFLAPGLRTSYVGSKHALRGFFDSLRAEVHEFGISVSTIYPGYVLTNVSSNALTSEAGKTLGKVDTNVGNGENVEQFSKKAIVAIKQKQKDAIITKDFNHKIAIYLRNIFFDLIHDLTLKDVQKQLEAVKKAV